MSDRRHSSRRPWRDHPLRETFLAYLEPGAVSALIPAAAYLEAALLEVATGPEPPGTHNRRVASGLLLDAQYLARETRGLLDGWPGSDPLRRAVVEALDNFEAAGAQLADVLDGEAEG